MWLGLGGQSSGHFSPVSRDPAPKPAEQPSHPAWQSGNTAGFLTRPTRDQQPRRRVPARATGAAELGQAGPICSEVPDEGREVREMCGWDLCGAREMLQAVHRKVSGGPFPRISRTLASWARESMAGAIVSEQSHVGQIGFRLPAARIKNPSGRPQEVWSLPLGRRPGFSAATRQFA